MRTETYERANIRRWLLLLLNCFFFAGTFFTMFNWGTLNINVWKFWKYISGFKVGKNVPLSDTTVNIGLRMSVIFLVVVPIIHVLKLLGLLGESRRNEAAFSGLLSAMELLGAIGLPALYVYVCFIGRGRLTSPNMIKVLFDPITTWAYIWIILIIIALILSIRLKPTPPIFKSLAGNNSKDVVCSACGRKNPQDASFCLGCGNKFTVNQGAWYCPACGSKNPPTLSQCASCGESRPKGY